MHIILHITQRQQWEQAKQIGIYRGDTLDTEGFIHCSTPRQIVSVANRFFLHQQGLVILWIDSDRVQAEIRYEEAEEQEMFPHIYGALNISAVLKVFDFPVDANGHFQLPIEVKNYADSIQ